MPTLFAYCIGELRMSSGTAYRRVRSVRVAEALPEVYALLREGSVNFTTLALIEPHIVANPSLLQKIRGKTTREVEGIVAEVAASERPRKPDSIRPIVGTSRTSAEPRQEKLFAGQPTLPAAAEANTGSLDVVATPASPPEVRSDIRFEAGEAFVRAVSRLRALLWHKYPEGRMEDLLLEAVGEFLSRRDPARPRRPAPERPADPRARRPPAAVEREVRLRDGECCAFVAADGRRCAETHGLELDHVVPWSLGGASNDAANLRLLCRAHNQAEARRLLGEGRVGPRARGGAS